MENDIIQPHWLELWNWKAQISLVLIVFVSAITAICQLVQIARQSRASFLLELDHRFESDQMIKARDLWKERREAISKKVSAANYRLADRTKEKAVQQEFAKELRRMRDKESADYRTIIRMLGFFETVGLTVKQGYVRLDDIDKLFHGPIVHMRLDFGEHIKECEEETGTPGGLYEHALYLADEVAKNKPR